MPRPLRETQPYPFARLQQKKETLLRSGKPILDLSIGICPIGAPDIAVQTIKNAVEDKTKHHYSHYQGIPILREAIAAYYAHRYSVSVDAEREITALPGTKEGLFQIASLLTTPGNYAIIPALSYPVYKAGVIQAGGIPYTVPLSSEKEGLPDLSAIPSHVAQNADILFLNFPHNPTGTRLTDDFINELSKFLSRTDAVVVHDCAYSEIYRHTPHPSLLYTPLRKRVIEFHSFSKNYGMSGFRLGFTVGPHEIVQSFVSLRATRASSLFEPLQLAAANILLSDNDESQPYRDHCNRNRAVLEPALTRAGLKYAPHQEGYFIWCEAPTRSAETYADFLLEHHGIFVIPESVFGGTKDRFFRLSVAADAQTVQQTAQLITQI